MGWEVGQREREEVLLSVGEDFGFLYWLLAPLLLRFFVLRFFVFFSLFFFVRGGVVLRYPGVLFSFTLSLYYYLPRKTY